MEESLRKCPLCRHNGFMSDDICEDCENQSKFEIMPEVEEALRAERLKGCMTADAIKYVAKMQADKDELYRGFCDLVIFIREPESKSIRNGNDIVNSVFYEVMALHRQINSLKEEIETLKSK